MVDTEVTEQMEKKEMHNHDDSDSDDHHDHGNAHGDHDDHGHDHKGEVGPDGKRANRGEKKIKKALLKLGLIPVTGITRVTIRKGKNVGTTIQTLYQNQLLLYIEAPEVYKTPGVENSYMVFGEAKMNDYQGNIANDEAKKFKDPEFTEQEQPEKKESVAIQANNNENETDEVDETGIPADSIKMVMEHCKCDRKAAVKALRHSNGDTVNAIMQLSE